MAAPQVDRSGTSHTPEPRVYPAALVAVHDGQSLDGPAPCHALRLLDLPDEILDSILQEVHHSLRSVCRRFREFLDGGCVELRIRHPARGASLRLAALTTLTRRLPHLRLLDNSGHDFKTLPFLTACASLEALTLTNCTITAHNLQPALAACTRLQTLDLSGCRQLSTIASVAPLGALRSLNLSACDGFTCCDALVHCPQLTSLQLAGGPWGWMDLTSLAALPALSVFAVDRNGNHGLDALDLSPLATCSALTSVSLKGCRVDDLGPLCASTRLSTLLLDSPYGAASLGHMAPCLGSLTRLSLTNLDMDSIDEVAACGSLTDLALCALAGVASVTAFTALTCLSALRLEWCSHVVVDYRPLAALGPSLTRLCLREDHVTNIDMLASCVLLVDLELECFRLVSLLPLLACTQLTRLVVACDRGIPAQQYDQLRVARGPQLCIKQSNAWL